MVNAFEKAHLCQLVGKWVFVYAITQQSNRANAYLHINNVRESEVTSFIGQTSAGVRHKLLMYTLFPSSHALCIWLLVLDYSIAKLSSSWG